MSQEEDFMRHIPPWYRTFFSFLPERELESVHLQIEFDKPQRSEKLPPLQVMADACIKLYKNRKVRSRYFAYLTGKLASSCGRNNEIKQLVEEIGNIPELLLWKGTLLVGEGDYAEATKIYEECEKSITSENPYPYLELKLAKSNIVIATNEFEKGLEENDELMDLIDFIQRQHEGIDTSVFENNGKTERVQIFLELGRVTEAQELMEKLLNEVESLENFETRINIYVIGGLLKNALSQIQESKELFMKARILCTEIGEVPTATFIDGILGVYKIMEGNREEGQKILRRAINKFQELNSLWDVVQFSMTLAHSYMGADQKSKAHKLIKDLDIYLDKVKQVTQAIAIDVAHIAINNEDIYLAQKYIDKLKFSLTENPSVYNEISLYILESALESTQANMNTGIRHTEKALQIAENNEIFPQVLTCKIRLASLNLTKWMYVENDKLLHISRANLQDVLMLIPSDSPNKVQIEVVNVLLGLLMDTNFADALEGFDRIEKSIKMMSWGQDIIDKFDKAKNKVIELKKLSDQSELPEDDVRILLYNTIRRILISLSGIQVDETKKTDIRMILVLNEAGLPIYVKNFGKGGENEDILLSAFLTALNSFSAVFSDTPEGHLETIRHENYTILVEIYLSFMIAMICVEETYETHQKLHKFVTQLSKDEFVKFKELAMTTERLPEFEKSVNKKVEQLFPSTQEEQLAAI
jgi:tetratricopeptide (TPR) repeat protein